MKVIKRLLHNLMFSNPKKAFYILVKCTDCGEEIKVRINRSSDFQSQYNADNPDHCYTIKKEIIGKDCFNLMSLTLGLTKNIKVLFTDTKDCEFLGFGRE